MHDQGTEDCADPGAGGIAASARRQIEGEIGRRLVHVSGAVIPLTYVLGLPYLWLQVALLAAVAIVGVLELLRLRTDFSWWAYEHLTREYESDTVAGYALYVVAMAIVALAFSPRIAIPAMLMLAVADPVGGVLGGTDPTPVKRPRAFLGAFLVSFAVSVPFVAPIAAAAGAVAASLADGVFMEIRGVVVDDNLTIPLAAAGAIALLLAYGPV